ncbi:H-2 class I histocompatibility antigen, Q10 alpha chain-like isoform X2 [Lepisosteus oculatus]|uniref:H-2 class I histocompatibility antigen, Q10 alpha chain-like isoform X2 n=1 Tax=Lepisosteus oculatus TaxID=7918 RepID=UPI0035F52902
MAVLEVLLLLLSCGAAGSGAERHSLHYIYTALSKPVDGIPEFTAMGVLNDRRIDYYDNWIMQKIPKQSWMKTNMPQEYWEKGTQSRKSKEQWFKVNVGILMDRMRQNNSDLHILQWMHGCEIEVQPGSEPQFLRGYDQYSYDGRDFLSFDESKMQWVAPVRPAEPTKHKWDREQILNQYTKGYLERECVDWLTKFLGFGEQQIKKSVPPDVHMFAKRSLTPGQLTLTCLATGFYPPDVQVDLYRDGVMLLEKDRVLSSGVRPNGAEEDTYQLRKSLEIRETDKRSYSCEVKHSSLKEPVVRQWGGSPWGCDSAGDSASAAVILGLAAALLVLLGGALVLLVLHRKGTLALSAKYNLVNVKDTQTKGHEVSGPAVSVSGPAVSGPAVSVSGPAVSVPVVNVSGPAVSGPVVSGPVVGVSGPAVSGPVVSGPVVSVSGPAVSGPAVSASTESGLQARASFGLVPGQGHSPVSSESSAHPACPVPAGGSTRGTQSPCPPGTPEAQSPCPPGTPGGSTRGAQSPCPPGTPGGSTRGESPCPPGTPGSPVERQPLLPSRGEP